MEKGVCSWCKKSGIISFIPLEQNFKDSKMNIAIEQINNRVIATKLIKIAEGLFACKECVSSYGLKV